MSDQKNFHKCYYCRNFVENLNYIAIKLKYHISNGPNFENAYFYASIIRRAQF